ncbi:MAG: hypothetical protein ACI4GY_09250 [Acutalibacteraceae bacterium]
MKKEVKAVICIVLSLWLFFIGFEVGSIREKKVLSEELAASAAQTTTASQTTTEIQSTTAMPQTEATTDAVEITTIADIPAAQGDVQTTLNGVSEEQTTEKKNADPSSLSKEEILKNVTDAFEALRTEQNMTANKTEKVTIQLTELSVPGAKNIVNNIIQNLAGEETESYTFTGGVGTGTDDDGKEVSGVKVSDVIPPEEGFKLTADGIATATAEKQGDSTVYTIKLVEENTTFTEPRPTHNAAAFGYLDLTTLDISGATITDANMHYPGTTITLTVNTDGKITNLHFNMPMDGNGAAKITVFNGTASFEGSDDEIWEITY